MSEVALYLGVPHEPRESEVEASVRLPPQGYLRRGSLFGHLLLEQCILHPLPSEEGTTLKVEASVRLPRSECKAT